MVTKKTVMIVEDNHAILNIYQRIVEKSFDVYVVVADTGEAALDHIKVRPVDLILCDLMLPEISGFEVIETLKNDPKYKDIPIIIISAVADQVQVMNGIKAGANDYLVKPAPQKLMVEKISRYLNMEPIKSASQ